MNVPPPTPGQTRLLWSSLTALAVTVLVALFGLLIWSLGWILRELSAVLLPIVLALILAYILDPVVEMLVRRRVPRFWAFLSVFVAGLVVVGALAGSVVPGLLRETHTLLNDLPRNKAAFHEKLNDFLERSPLMRQIPGLWLPPEKAALGGTNLAGAASLTNGQASSPGTNAPAARPAIDLDNMDQLEAEAAFNTNYLSALLAAEPLRMDSGAQLSESVMLHLSDFLNLVLKWLTLQLRKATTWAEFLVGFVLVPVYLFYFLLEKQRINKGWTDYLPLHESKVKEEAVFVLKALNDCMIVFFRGQVLVALIVGTLLTCGYLLMGLKYAVLLGATAAVLGIVPYLGTITTLVLALTVAAVQFGDWLHPLEVLALAVLVKMLEDFVVGPKIIGDRSGLHPLAIIVAVMVGTTLLGGVLGALFAIPLTAVLRTLMFRYVWKRRAVLEAADNADAGTV